MPLQYDPVLRTNQVAQLQTTVGATGHLKIFSGAMPANCATADPAGLLADIVLPASFLTSANGVTTIAGTWSVTATGAGTAQCFRMYDGGAVCHIQGNVTTDLTLNNTSIAVGQPVTVTAFSVTAGNV
jgi:hypothetical protein